MQLLCHKEESNFIFVPAIRTTRNQLWHIKQRKKKIFFRLCCLTGFLFFLLFICFFYTGHGVFVFICFFFAVCDLMSLFLSYSGLDNECLVGLDDLAFLNGALVHSA